MDPNAALYELLSALEDFDRDIALERLEALTDWLKAGGFLPTAEENGSPEDGWSLWHVADRT